MQQQRRESLRGGRDHLLNGRDHLLNGSSHPLAGRKSPPAARTMNRRHPLGVGVLRTTVKRYSKSSCAGSSDRKVGADAICVVENLAARVAAVTI
jgi:hypothetical protein